VDNRFYLNPKIYNNRVMISVDEGDDLLVTAKAKRGVLGQLKKLGIRAKLIGELEKVTTVFPPEWNRKEYWEGKIDLLGPIPVPTESEGFMASPPTYGVWLAWNMPIGVEDIRALENGLEIPPLIRKFLLPEDEIRRILLRKIKNQKVDLTQDVIYLKR